MVEKAFTYYELQGTHPNITTRFDDKQVAFRDFEQLKAVCDNLCLTKYEFSKADGYLLSPDIKVLRTYKVYRKEKKNGN